MNLAFLRALPILQIGHAATKLLLVLQLLHTDNFRRRKKVLHSWRIRSSNFDLKFLGVRLAAFEAEASARNIFAVHNVITMSKAPHTSFEAHLRAHMLPPILPARRGRWFRRYRNRNGSGHR